MNKEGHTNVFVKFLPPTVDDTELCTLFSKFGTIVSCKVMINQVTGVSLGYGFVRFSCEEEAKKAIEGMVGCKLGTKTLLCKLSDPFCFPDPSCNLYIKPLPLGLSDDELRIVFAKYGQIATVKLVADVGIPDSLVGFVKYESMDSATRAIEELNGAKIFALLPPLIVKYAESDVQRAVRKANCHPPSRKQPFLSSPMSPSLQESLSLKNKLMNNSNSDFEVPSQSPPNSPRKPIYDFDLPLLNSSCSSNYYSADNYVSYMPCYYVPVQVYYYDRAVPDYSQPSYSYSSSYSSYPQHLQQ